MDVVIRQAHPGPDVPPYESPEEKLWDAERYQREEGIPYTVLVDDLRGTTHLAYGGMADPTYLLDSDGRVAFYNLWSHAPTLHLALEELFRQGGRGVVRGGVDRTPHLLPAMTEGWRGLRRGLPQSLIDLELASPGAGAMTWLGYQLRPLLAPVSLRSRPLPPAARAAIGAAAGLGALLAVRTLVGRRTDTYRRNAESLRRPGRAERADLEEVTAAEGSGPLLQRDYWGVIEGARLTPEQTIDQVLSDVPSFSPSELAAFSRLSGEDGPARVGEDFRVSIQGYGPCHVRLTQRDPDSFTFQTLAGHLETGRISFGAERDRAGNLVFRIRSRSRTNSPVNAVGYALIGIHAQTAVWTTFVRRVAEAAGGRLLGKVEVRSRRVSEDPEDEAPVPVPTFASTAEG